MAVFAALLLSSGCAHKTIIRTEPAGAEIRVDDELIGVSPVVVERWTGTGGKMRIQASRDGFQDATLDVMRTEWFFWPALLVITPAIGMPLMLLAPPFGAFIAVGWACFTCPTAISLFFIQKYPDEVVVELPPRLFPGKEDFLPTDDWTVPDEYVPNPLPLPRASPPEEADAPDVDEVPEEKTSQHKSSNPEWLQVMRH